MLEKFGEKPYLVPYILDKGKPPMTKTSQKNNHYVISKEVMIQSEHLPTNYCQKSSPEGRYCKETRREKFNNNIRIVKVVFNSRTAYS